MYAKKFLQVLFSLVFTSANEVM